MADVAETLMDVNEFFAWQAHRERCYEFDNGVPVLRSRLSTLHDLIVTNIMAVLKSHLRSSNCRPTTASIALRTRIRSLRRPDVTVTCDPPRYDVYEALEPRLVVEVLSPSNTGVKWDP